MAACSPVEPVPLPSSWMETRSWSLVPVANEVPDSWGDVIPGHAAVGVAGQGIPRGVVPGGDVQRVAPSQREILKRADLVGLSHLDVARDTSLGDLARLLHPRARLLVPHAGQ